MNKMGSDTKENFMPPPPLTHLSPAPARCLVGPTPQARAAGAGERGTSRTRSAKGGTPGAGLKFETRTA